MRPRRAAILAAAAAVVSWSAGCRRSSDSAAAASGRGGPPRGDAVWLTDAAALGDEGIEDRLARLSAVAVFAPAGEMGLGSGRWVLKVATAPPRPLARESAVLVVRAGPELKAALAAEGGPDPDGVAQALAAGLAASLRPNGPYGRVIGVHLDFPFAAVSARRSGDLLDAVKKRLPAGTFLSIAAAFPAPRSDEDRKALAPLVDRADALVAPVFGLEGRTDAAAVDSLRRPWWAAFGAGARGTLVRAGGAAEALPEQPLDALSGNPRIDFENDLSAADASFASFHLTARGPVRAGGLDLEPGDRITYRVPVLGEMLFQLGSTMAGKRFALGRLFVFDGPSEAGRIFPIAALEDVILGRALAPVLRSSVRDAGRNAIAVDAINVSPHASIASRTANWVEVDVAPAHPADVALGGFDRYATYDGNGQAVTPGRATRVRLFETVVLPGEEISPARIVLRGGAPARCCRFRTHLIAASGSEAESSWIEPPVPPTPTRPPQAPARKKR